jgi:hypothetical protein
MAARVHRPLRIVAFNASGLWRQGSGKEVYLHIDVTLLSQIYFKHNETFFIPNYHLSD